MVSPCAIQRGLCIDLEVLPGLKVFLGFRKLLLLPLPTLQQIKHLFSRRRKTLNSEKKICPSVSAFALGPVPSLFSSSSAADSLSLPKCFSVALRAHWGKKSFPLNGLSINLTSFVHMLNFVNTTGVVGFILVTGV